MADLLAVEIKRFPGSIFYHDATTNVADLTAGTGNDAFQPQVRSEIAIVSSVCNKKEC